MTAIIIEDEPAAQQYLQQLLQQNFPALTIVAVADNVPGAIQAIVQFEPDILFMDIAIKSGTGFDVLAALPAIKSEIIFTTAFNQFAIDAFKYHAIDYLLKPLEDEVALRSIRHCITRVEQKTGNQQIARLLQHLQQPDMHNQRFGIHTIDGIEFINLDDIIYAAAKGNYTELKLKSGVKMTTSKKLKEVEQAMPATLFYRIHHSYIINFKYVKKYHKGRGGYVMLEDHTSLPVSSARKDDFLKQMGSE